MVTLRKQRRSMPLEHYFQLEIFIDHVGIAGYSRCHTYKFGGLEITKYYAKIKKESEIVMRARDHNYRKKTDRREIKTE